MKFINILLLFAALGLTACGEKIEGVFTSDNTVTINQGDDVVSIPANTYDAVIKIKANSDGLKTKVTLKNEHSKFKFDLEIPTENIPEEDESIFTIPGSAIGQSFNIVGIKQKTHRDSREHRTIEHCDYQAQRCYPVKRPDGRVETVCRLHNERGTRNVTYFVRTHKKTIEVILNDFKRNPFEISLGEFKSEEIRSEQIYTFIGHCHGRHVENNKQ